MTVIALPSERWEREDGAPAGPSFDYEIPSSRRGHGPYRLVRDSVTGVVIHRPACEAWQHGRRHCRHVQDAVHRTEQPASAFLAAVDALRLKGDWWLGTEDEDELRFGAQVVRLCIDALRQQAKLAEEYEIRTRDKPSSDDAIREFGAQ